MPRNPGRYAHLVAFALEHPWAITPSMGGIIASILARRMAGDDADQAVTTGTPFEARTSAMATVGDGAVAVIPFAGVVAPRMNLLSDMSGGVTFEGLTQQLQAAVADPTIKTIVFDVDSPGGNVAGATEFAREVLKARTQKTIIAHANYLLASAAYWTMAAATEIVAAPSALVGGIGVLTLHDDISAALEKLGVKREVLSAGKFKGEGADGGPLTAEARAHIQDLIDGAYGRFVGDVAKGRGVKPAEVRNGFGQGRALSADAALEAGLIDRIATLQDTLARVTKPTTVGRTRAEDDAPPVVTDQEPRLAATSQEPRAGRDPHRLEFEQRVFALRLKGLQP